MLFAIVIALLSLLPVVLASRPRLLVPRDSDASDAPDPTLCGQIIDAVNEGYTDFYAVDVYDCLRSVPFDAKVALTFLDYYNTTLEFQSTTAYLKNPPTGYKQPSVDVFGRLNTIKSNVTAGFFKNQYEFEAAVQEVVYEMHDGHVDLSAGILSVFSFTSPLSVTSASKDGVDAPQLYFTDDVLDIQVNGQEPSPIVSINGRNATDFMVEFAAKNAVGNLDPHADWNQLMASPALDIQGYVNIFVGGATFFPGDALNFTLADGTQNDTYWLASFDYPGDVPNITTPQDFYNYFVLDIDPTTTNSSSPQRRALPSTTSASATSASTGAPYSGIAAYVMKGLDPTAMTSSTPDYQPPVSNVSWSNDSFGAYPDNPDIVQPDLAITGGGILTAYFFEDISTAILSVPSFQLYGEHIVTFAETVGDFIGNATAKKLDHVIIDLQQNTGGAVVLALTMFKQLFPQLDPFGGSRRRSHSNANIIGTSINGWWDRLNASNSNQTRFIRAFASDEWVVTDRLNTQTETNFSSWAEYYGPKVFQADNFSLTERYNLHDDQFMKTAFGGFYPYGYGPHNTIVTSQPWKPESIVLLTDGLCGSACALFLEMMTHEAGVRTVVMGGNPGKGPMQAASGNRGAVFYDADSLDDSFEDAREVSTSANQTLPDRDNTGILINYAPFNLRDQIRHNNDTPLQFQDIPANCRLYYTLANVYNMSRLWRDVYDATWHDSSRCVSGSKNSLAAVDTFNSTKISAKEPPGATSFRNWLSVPPNSTVDLNSVGGIQDASGASPGLSTEPQVCQANSPCRGGAQCTTFKISCDGTTTTSVSACLSKCQSTSTCKGTCRFTSAKESKVFTLGRSTENAPSGAGAAARKFIGLCFPSTASRSLGCKNGAGSVIVPNS